MTGGTVAVTEDSETVLAGVSAGSLSLTSNGTITDADGAAIDVTGLATLNAGNNAITLGDQRRRHHALRQPECDGRRGDGHARTAKRCWPGVSAASLSLTSNGPITDADGAAIDVTGLATLNAGNNAITLGDQAADSTHFGSLNLTGGAVTVSEDSETVLAGVSAASLTLTATARSRTRTGQRST